MNTVEYFKHFSNILHKSILLNIGVHILIKKFKVTDTTFLKINYGYYYNGCTYSEA